MIDVIYKLLGKPVTKYGEISYYKRDPLIFLFMELPGVLGILAMLFGLLNLPGASTPEKSYVAAIVWCVSGLVGVLWALLVFLCYYATIADPDVAMRQFWTKNPRFFTNGYILIPWLQMKSLILPGSSEIFDSDEILATVAQANGNFDQQVLSLQINFSLEVKNSPRKVLEAFYDQFVQFRLENLQGTWLARMERAKKAVMKLVAEQVLRRLDAVADAGLSGMTMESIVKKRSEANARMLEFATDTFSNELGIHVLSLTITDIQDLNGVEGWVTAMSRKAQAENAKEATIVVAEAQKAARVAESNAMKDAEQNHLQNAGVIAQEKVKTLEQQALAAAAEAKVGLQNLRARALLIEEKGMQVAFATMLQKLEEMPATEVAAILKEVASKVGNVPTTAVSLGSMLDIHPLMAIVAAFKALTDRFSPPAP